MKIIIGVDWYRTLGAVFTFATHGGKSSFGGSTITQQLVKNFKAEKEDTGIDGALRKAKEIVRAYEVENMLSKNQILELYLNLIPLGRDVYGVETASKYYFNKKASELTIAQAAYLAGITSAPSTYNPFSENNDRTERINNKVKTVLKKMLELGRITEEEYNAGIQEVENGIGFSKGEVAQNNKLNYYLDAARDQVIKDLMAEYKWSKEEAELHFYGDGYSVYTAYDQNLQAEIDKEFVTNAKKWYNVITVTRTNQETGEKYKEQVQRQGAMIVLDNETGNVVAGVGGLGEKPNGKVLNRMYQVTHSPGSCMKPIGVVGPSLEEGVINIGSVIDDVPIDFGGYSPKNWYLKRWLERINEHERNTWMFSKRTRSNTSKTTVSFKSIIIS